MTRTSMVWRSAVVLAGMAVIAAGCSSDNKSESSDSGATFTDGAQLIAENLTSYDPGLVQTLDESQVTTALYDGLTDFDWSNPEAPELKGLAADSWTANADSSEFTFKIKDGLEFSNGDPVLPSSFAYAWVRNGQSEFASPYGYLIDYVKGGTALQDGTVTNLDSAIVADDSAMTLKVTLEAPQADFPAIVSHPFFGPLPEKEVSKLKDQNDWGSGIMIGNGPFKMDAAANDQQVVLVRNDSWAGNVSGDTRAVLDKLVFKISQSQDSAYTDFEAGNTQSASIPSGQFTAATETYKNTTSQPQLGSYHFDFGFTDPQLGGVDNTLLRQAISLAIDRDEINQKVYEGFRTTSTGITPNGIPGFEPGLCKFCTFDPTAAKALITQWKEAGGQLTGPITLDFNTDSGNEPVVAIIQQNLKAVGIDSELNGISEKYFGTMAEGGCHFCRAGWYADYPTYGNFMFDLYSTASVGGNNMGSFSDPVFDDLVNTAQSEPDSAKRSQLYRDAETYLLNDSTGTVPINWYNGDQVYADNVVGYTQPPLGIIAWENVGIKPS
ncbi:ABC-type oligopeptide transport system, periplasmic component [Actinobacteria bacterium IMCC26207]|nr:ABC-type oligopeptide transport system, periplasmic component [Actinobacteria bacterium IMCC26207]